MRYDHMVKANGKYYQAGEDVPDTRYTEENKSLVTKKGNTAYTRTDINGMSTAELQKLAEEEGVENAYETSGRELKKILVEHFGL